MEWNYTFTDDNLSLDIDLQYITYIAAFDCSLDLSDENQYFYNGLNYALMVFAKQDGVMKLVEFGSVDYVLLSKYVTQTIEKSDDN